MTDPDASANHLWVGLSYLSRVTQLAIARRGLDGRLREPPDFSRAEDARALLWLMATILDQGTAPEGMTLEEFLVVMAGKGRDEDILLVRAAITHWMWVIWFGRDLLRLDDRTGLLADFEGLDPGSLHNVAQTARFIDRHLTDWYRYAR